MSLVIDNGSGEKKLILKVNANDNVLVALKDLKKGDVVSYNGEDFVLQNDIPAKHKFFTQDMNAGDEVKMYGVLVGTAQAFIPKGGLMTTANISHAAEPYHYRHVSYQ